MSRFGYCFLQKHVLLFRQRRKGAEYPFPERGGNKYEKIHISASCGDNTRRIFRRLRQDRRRALVRFAGKRARIRAGRRIFRRGRIRNPHARYRTQGLRRKRTRILRHVAERRPLFRDRCERYERRQRLSFDERQRGDSRTQPTHRRSSWHKDTRDLRIFRQNGRACGSAAARKRYGGDSGSPRGRAFALLSRRARRRRSVRRPQYDRIAGS